MLRFLLAASSDTPSSLMLWGPAAVLLVALGVFAKWGLNRIDSETKAKDALAQQIITQAIPALAAATEAIEETRKVVLSTRSELDSEREQRIRLEERLRFMESKP